MRRLNFSQQSSADKQKQFVNSNSKRNKLTDRLFDRPQNRSLSDRRPKIFSNQSQKHTLLPKIVKQHHKKNQATNNPQATRTNFNQRIRTQSSGIQDYVQIQKISSLKQLAEEDKRKLPSNHAHLMLKTKNAFNKTKYFEQSKMNRTLSDSRQIVTLMDKMQGKQGDSPIKQKQQQLKTTFFKKNPLQKPKHIKTQSSLSGSGSNEILFGQQKVTNPNSKQTIQSFKQIDLFVYMSEGGRVPQYEFYYMLKNQSNDYYNMEIVTYQSILKNKASIQEYFTLSGSGITRYEMSRPMDFLPLNQWDRERKQFNQIKQLMFFKKFRKWKTLKKWIFILSREKLTRICQVLSQKLFILTPQYRSVLLQHSYNSFQLQQLKFITIPSEPLTIQHFRQAQQKKKNLVVNNLKQMSKKMHGASVDGLKEIVEELKNKIADDSTIEELPEKGNNNKQLDEKTQVFADLGFPSYISYGHRSMIRSEFMRFLRFAYLLDFIVTQSIGKMIICNVEYIQEFLVMGNIDYDEEQEIKMPLPEGLQFGVTHNADGKNIYHPLISSSQTIVKPLFLVQIKLEGEHESHKRMNSLTSALHCTSQNFESCKSPFYSRISSIMQSRKITFTEATQNFMKFDIQGFAYYKSLNQIEKAGKSIETEQFSYDQDTKVSYRYSQNLSRKIIKIVPSKEKIIANILDLFNDTLDSIQVIKRWSKNQDQFSDYIKALEQWDQIIGDSWEPSQSIPKYLTPVNWIKEHHTYQGFKYFIKNSIFNTYSSIQTLLQQHNDILNLHVRNQVSDYYKCLTNPLLEDQLTVFDENYHKLIKCEEYLQQYLIEKAQLHIYLLDFQTMCSIIIQQHKSTIKKVCLIYCGIVSKRSEQLKKWLQISITQTTGPIIRIQQFVNSKTNLERISLQLPQKKHQISILSRLVQFLQTSAFSNLVSKQQKQRMNELSTLSSTLFLSISQCQSQLPKYIDRFRREIKLSLQKFEKQLQQLKDKVNQDRFTKNQKSFDPISIELNQISKKVQQFENYTNKHRKYQQVLEITQFTNFKHFKDFNLQFTTKRKVFNGIVNLQKYGQQWKEMKVMHIDVKSITQVTDQYMKDLLLAERIIPDNKAISVFKKVLYNFKDAIPVISALRCPYLESQDFIKIQKLLKLRKTGQGHQAIEPLIRLQKNQQLSLGQFLRLPFQQVQQQIIDVSIWSTQYTLLKKQVQQFQSQWISTELKLKQYKQTSDIIIIYDIQQLLTKLDQFLATVSNLLSNRYIGPLRDRAEKLLNDVILAQETVDKIVQCQRKWVYLQNIFAAPDIKKQLMVEAGYFVTADKFLKNLMKRTYTKPLISRLIRILNVLVDLTKMLQLLQQIQKKLQDYLQVKRRLFPRFYFISNQQLVQILANSNNTQIIQKHISKLFQGIQQMLILPQTPSTLDGMISPQGQQIKFITSVSMRFNIQIWLGNMQKQMVQTIKRYLRDGVRNFVNGVQKTRQQWILNHKSQVVNTGNQIIWSTITQDSIKQQASRRDSLDQWYELLKKQLLQITQLIRSDIKPLYHKIVVALITSDVHNRDIVNTLIQNQVQSIYDFNWQQQLKYSLDEQDMCLIRQVNALMDYGYQYIGATTRLIITPLTDKCWITITSAIAHHLGASPAGPAGTGKTQSTKDLAKGLARVCIVFNCSDQITAQMMNKLFSGLAQQGAWTCLDQFNRIDIEVLSVIAQQLLSIRIGLKRDKGQVQLEGKLLPVRRNFGVFITMNPGYAGRTQLPDNLKSLFRPVSMMIPDYTMIAQIMLFAQGFSNASDLARKMVQLYKLASQQLSQQKHYDFGLRAVKSLLVMAGQLKRSDSKQSQQVLLIKAMKQSNIPKFLQSDIYLFQSLVSDLFPNVQIQTSVNNQMLDVLLKVIKENKFGGEKELALKVMQLHQVLGVRFGVMIVGQAGVGKTTVYRMLKQTMIKIIDKNPEIGKKYYKLQQKIINPKSVTMGQLYGEIDLLSQEWTDGLMSSIIRQCNNCQQKSHYWITLDGPVDALWIQNLNTVLDDNLTLCLANGQRIKLRQELRMLFEVQNLQVASPATVSRCGMVYMPQNLNHLHYIQSQINQIAGVEQDFKQLLIKCSTKLFQKIFQNKKKWFEPISTTQLQVSQCFICLLKHFIPKAKLTNSYQENLKKINVIYAYCIIWSVGSSIQSQYYDNFQTVIRTQFQQQIHLPKTQSLFDFFINTQNYTSFISWQAKIQQFEYRKQLQFHDIIVPTIDSEKYTYIIQILLKLSKAIIVTGDSGVGKTSLVVPFLFSLKQSYHTSTIFLNFSAKTKPRQTQLAIQSKLNKKAKTIFGARPNQNIVIFIDDINLPEIQQYGAQPTIELLRNYLDYQGFYDRNKLFWKDVVDTTLIACGATPNGGRNHLNKRFTRHSMVICVPQPSQSNLKKIFGSILKGFMQVQNFNQPLKKLCDGLINCTLSFYNTIRSQLLPIPSKFHYLFNLRDISKVLQGILQCSYDTINNSCQRMIQLWAHQTQRIFGDRLNNTQDKQWFYKTIEIISKRYTEGIDRDQLDNKGNSINFTKILTNQTGQPTYQYVTELAKVSYFLQAKIYQYNVQMNGKLDLIFFKQAIQHVLRISRVIFQQRGNAMLVGVGGSGKQSLSKIASFISSSKIYQLEMGRGYNNQSFRTDLQKIAISSGADQEKLSFLFVDTQIIYEEFLESINNMLNTGQVPNLFKKKQQIDEIINKVRPNALKKKKVDSPQSLWSYFISNIRANLHVILCMSPAGDSLRIRCRKFPSLVNCCTIDWFESWTEQALTSVSKKIINNMQQLQEPLKIGFNKLCTEANVVIKSLCEQYYQNERRRVETTPKTFLDQLQLFSSVLHTKKKQINLNKKALTDGLQKLYATNQVVSKLKIQMFKLQPQLQQQAIKTDQFLKRLAIDKSQANLVQSQVQAQTQQANEQMGQIKIIKQQAQSQLGKAMPMLLQAQQALKKINKNDITEIRGYASPHPIVQMVMQATFILLNQKIDWPSIKSVMMDLNFIDRLRNYDKNNIPESILKKLRTYTKKPQFQPVLVGQKNLASKSLCMWCRAIDNYSYVVKEVQPKKKKLNDLQKVFEDKNKILFMKQKELQKVKSQVAKLQKECQQTLQLKNKLQNDLQLTTKRLQRAQKLNILLKDQGLRWSSMIENYKTTQLQIPGQAFIASLYLSYLGPFTGSYRQSFKLSLFQKLKGQKILFPLSFSLTSTLYDQITIRDWILQTLPNDPISIQNAIICKKGLRYPLMIDPQSQANKWIKINMREHGLKVVNFDQKDYLRNLEMAIKNGMPILIQEVGENLESAIDGLLAKKLQIVDGLKLIALGDKKIQFDDKFYLYMTTRLSNPKFLAEIFNKSTVINFSITQNGLRDQLLGQVCKLQNPQAEQKRDQIIVKVASNKKFLKQSQDKTLKLLSQTQGMILDDTELIITLEQSKMKAKQVQKDLEHNSILEEEINRSRSQYLSVAIRGTILYFVIQKLSHIQSMYDFSLNYVKKLYNTGLQKAQKHQIQQLRIRKLNQSITKIMYTDISKALFESHKKLYSFLICCSIKKQSKHIHSSLWQMFSKGIPLRPKTFKQQYPNPDVSLFSQKVWYELHKFSELKEMSPILSEIRNNVQKFKNYFYTKENVFNLTFPGKDLHIINNFLILLLTKIVRPENLVENMTEYVKKQIGKFFAESHLVTIQDLLDMSSYDTPVLFILSTGVDPTNNILNYCQHKNINLQTISLGQGQGKKAAHLIQRSVNDGSWVLLNNCHLAKSWLGSLEKIIQGFSLQSNVPNKKFRLLMSSMPVSYFPSNILQNANKCTLQPPRGIKPNLLRSFKQVSQQTINSCPNRRREWLQCLYSLTFFHALVQQRRKYGPLGFNIRYQFNDSDLEMSLGTLKLFLNDVKEEVNWDAIWYMVGQINYGGRVTDNSDRITLITMLKKCITPDLLNSDKYFYSDSDQYYCLNCVTLQDFQMSIDRLLPQGDSPQVFGLHSNANLSYIIQQSNNYINSIQKFQPRGGNNSNSNSKQNKILELINNLSQLPLPINCLILPDHMKGENDKVLPSMTNFFLQECEKFNTFLHIIKESLEMLEKAIKGSISMNQDLDEMVLAFENNKVPALWKKYCYQTLKPLGSWFIDFKKRIQFLLSWSISTPSAYWISCFFFPQGLLTSLLQTYSRKYKISIDSLSFKFKVTQIQKQKIITPKDGGYIYGMFFEGARYDCNKDTLMDEEIGRLHQDVGCVHLLPTEGYEIGEQQYNCPLYKTGKRSGNLSTTGQSTNFILGVHLNTKIQKPQFWTLRGTALVCQLND